MFTFFALTNIAPPSSFLPLINFKLVITVPEPLTSKIPLIPFPSNVAPFSEVIVILLSILIGVSSLSALYVPDNTITSPSNAESTLFLISLNVFPEGVIIFVNKSFSCESTSRISVS